MNITNRILTSFIGIVGSVIAVPVNAQEGLYELPNYVTSSIIDGNTLSNTRGRFAVNVAAGD
jgi:hypothetical protein